MRPGDMLRALLLAAALSAVALGARAPELEQRSPAAQQLARNRFFDESFLCLSHESLYRESLRGRSDDKGKVSYPCQAHVQCARNGRGGERENIYV